MNLILLAGAGAAATKALVRLAVIAEELGDVAHRDLILECLRRQGVATPDSHALHLFSFDVRSWLIRETRGAIQARLLDDLVDLADLRFHEPGEEYPVDWRGPDDVLSALLALADDYLHEDEPLGKRFLARLAELHHRSAWHRGPDLTRWKEAVSVLETLEGRKQAIRTFLKVFGLVPTEDLGEVDPTPDLWLTLPPLEGPGVAGLLLARPKHRQAKCPTCGRPMTLEGERLIQRCEYCGHHSRIGREARVLKRTMDAGLAAKIMDMPPSRLVDELLTTDDEALRAGIVDELAAATTDGGRYVELAPALVRYMVSEIPPEIEERLGHGFQRMLQHRDPEFREAFFGAVREQAFTVEGSHALLNSMEEAGPRAAPLLFDLFDATIDETEGFGQYAQQAKSIAFDLLSRDTSESEALEARVRWVLERLPDSTPLLGGDLTGFLGNLVFDRDAPFDEAHRVVLRFIDEHTNPERVSYLAGFDDQAPELFTPHYSPAFEDLHQATVAAGYSSWEEAARLGGYHILNIYDAVPAVASSRVSLHQVGTLVSQVTSFWKNVGGADVVPRLEFAASLAHEAPRLLVLNSLVRFSGGVDDEQRGSGVARSDGRRAPAAVAASRGAVAASLMSTPRPAEAEEEAEEGQRQRRQQSREVEEQSPVQRQGQGPEPDRQGNRDDAEPGARDEAKQASIPGDEPSFDLRVAFRQRHGVLAATRSWTLAIRSPRRWAMARGCSVASNSTYGQRSPGTKRESPFKLRVSGKPGSPLENQPK